MANRNMQAKLLKIKKYRQKNRKYSYDNLSPFALSTRNGKKIDLASDVPETWEFGRRGLHMGRAYGPTAVAKEVSNEAHLPTQVPRAVVMLEHRTLVEFEQSPIHQKYRCFHSIPMGEFSRWSITMWFSGDSFVFEKTMIDGTLYVSVVYNTQEARIRQKKLSKIDWLPQPVYIPKNSGGGCPPLA